MAYEAQLETHYQAREAALSAGDATAYNQADRAISSIFAAMRAEVRIGLRDDPIFTRSVEAV